jgi:hypothetical protein
MKSNYRHPQPSSTRVQNRSGREVAAIGDVRMERFTTHVKASELVAGIDYRLTDGGKWISIKHVFVNGNHTVVSVHGSKSTRSLRSNELVQVRP